MDRKKVVVFGLGKIYKMFLEVYDDSKIEIIALSDNNSSLLQTLKESGRAAVNPAGICDLQFDYVIVTSSYFERKWIIPRRGVLHCANCFFFRFRLIAVINRNWNRLGQLEKEIYS